MGKEALVVPRSILFKDTHFEGFLAKETHDFIPTILNNYEYHPRSDQLENDASLQQIIPYVWLVNPTSKKVFAYTRIPGKGDYKEKRLLDKFSCGLGGHIDKEDSENPIQNAMMRELEEEVVMKSYPDPQIIGYVNLEYDVHAVHFGVVAIAYTSETEVLSADGVKEGKWYSVEELENAFTDSTKDVEKWTEITWPFVRSVLR